MQPLRCRRDGKFGVVVEGKGRLALAVLAKVKRRLPVVWLD